MTGLARPGPAWTRAGLLMILALIEPALAQSPAAVPYPEEYKSRLVKYAVVDRADGYSRDLYVSPPVIEALQREPGLQELPLGALFAIDAHRARQVGR